MEADRNRYALQKEIKEKIMTNMPKEQRAVYDLNRYHERMGAAREQLGGRCVTWWCGATENLELDHIDPETKCFTLSSNWGLPEDVWQEELAKCQLLCRPCHELKTASENPVSEEHGTWAWVRWRKCKCEECRDFANAYSREYKRKKRAEKKAALIDLVP